MVQFLICLEVFNKGEKISLRELKRRRNDELQTMKHTNNEYLRDNDADILNGNSDIILDNIEG
jgi:hypothetical protein